MNCTNLRPPPDTGLTVIMLREEAVIVHADVLGRAQLLRWLRYKSQCYGRAVCCCCGGTATQRAELCVVHIRVELSLCCELLQSLGTNGWTYYNLYISPYLCATRVDWSPSSGTNLLPFGL